MAKPIDATCDSFPYKISGQKFKKIPSPFERAATLPRHNICGSGYPSPSRLYSARAPIHPKRAPYGLTRPVVPPDGSFVFGDISAAPLDEIGFREPRPRTCSPLQLRHLDMRLDCGLEGKPRTSTAFCRFRGCGSVVG